MLAARPGWSCRSSPRSPRKVASSDRPSPRASAIASLSVPRVPKKVRFATSFAAAPVPRAPTWTAVPNADSSGTARRAIGAGPPTRIVSHPDSAPARLPITGASSSPVPAGRTGARRVTAAGPNRGHLDHGQRCARAGGDAVGAFGDGPERGRVGHHGDQRVCLTGRLRRRCHCAGTQLDQRCRAGWGPVPDDRLVSRSQQPGGAARSPQGRRPAACWCASAAP